MRFGRTMTVVVLSAALAACGGDEDDPTGGGHGTVAGAVIVQDGTVLDEPIQLSSGSTMRLEVRFLDEDGDEVHGLLPGHAAALAFQPAGIAEATADFDDAFFFDVQVTGEPDDLGAVFVGYGHDGDTDEQTFGPFDVVVTAD